jgi:hypothetical protein
MVTPSAFVAHKVHVHQSRDLNSHVSLTGHAGMNRVYKYMPENGLDCLTQCHGARTHARRYELKPTADKGLVSRVFGGALQVCDCL